MRLKVLLAIVEEGSVTAAAEALGYAQPSISHHLRRLEAEVGVTLFQRAGRGLRPTDAGSALARRAEEILGQLDAAAAEAEAYAGLRTGRVRVAAFPSALAALVPRAIAAFTSRHPEVTISLVEAEPSTALGLVRSNDVDVALVFSHEDTPEVGLTHIDLTPLMSEPLFLITSGQDHRSATEITDHAGEAWIAGCPRCRAHLLAACERAGFVPQIDYETDDYVAVQALVAAGSGVSTLPALALQAHRNPAVRAVPIPGEVRTISVATYGRPPRAPAVAAFVEALTHAAESTDAATLSP